MTDDMKLMFLLRKLIERMTEQAVKDGADPAEFDLGFPIYKQNESFKAGDIRRDGSSDQPFECLIAYDGKVQPDWNLSTPSLWRPFHGKDVDHAYPWSAPTGAHDIYKDGDYMTFTDGEIWKCIRDTSFDPIQDSQSWQKEGR